MPLFGRSKQEDEVKQRANAFAEKQGMAAAPQEEGLEEGDISDYVMPVKGLGKNIVREGLMIGLKKGAEEAGSKGAVFGGKKLLEKLAMPAAKAEERVLDYSKSGAFKPTYTDTAGGSAVGNFGKDALKKRAVK